MNPYRSIQQIFYANKKFTIQDILNLQKYCLSNDLLRGVCCQSPTTGVKTDCIIGNIPPIQNTIFKTEENKAPERKEPPKITELISKNDSDKIISQISKTLFFDPKNPSSNSMQSKLWIPPHKDTLFWCIFSEIYGHSEYIQIGHSYGNRVLDEKMKIANFFKKNPKTMKSSNHKFTNEGIQETIAEFMVDQSTSLRGLASLAVYFKRNIYVLDEKRKIYLKFTSPDVDTDSSISSDSKIYIYYHEFMRGEHKYKISIDDKYTPPCIDQWFCLENFQKPLKSIAQYKVEELYAIANSIGFEIPTKIKKTELYEVLSEKCAWYKDTGRDTGRDTR